MPWLLYHWYPSDMWLGGSQSQFGSGADETIFAPTRNRTQISSHQTTSLVSILTELHWLYLRNNINNITAIKFIKYFVMTEKFLVCSLLSNNNMKKVPTLCSQVCGLAHSGRYSAASISKNSPSESVTLQMRINTVKWSSDF